VFYEIGKERPLEYPIVFNVGNMDWNPVTDQQAFGLGQQPVKTEGAQFGLDEHIIGNQKAYTAVAYGSAVEFTWESWRDEQYGILEQLVAEQGRMTRQRQEVQAWSILTNAFDTAFNGFESGVSLCSLSHVGVDGVTRANRPTPDVGLSVAALQDMIMRYETMTTERGVPRLLQPTMIVIHPADKFVAREVLGSSGTGVSASTTNNEINALIQEDLTWMVSHYLTSDTAWFALAAKGVHDLNFLWRDPPMFDAFDDPWSKNAVFTAYQRFATGYGAWAGVDGSDGA